MTLTIDMYFEIDDQTTDNHPQGFSFFFMNILSLNLLDLPQTSKRTSSIDYDVRNARKEPK